MDMIVYGDERNGYFVHDEKGVVVGGPHPSMETAIAAMDEIAAPHLCPECGRYAA
jgi:hypothetical protein